MADGVGVCPGGGCHVPASVTYRLSNGDGFAACTKCACIILVEASDEPSTIELPPATVRAPSED